ncbi:MAG: hypothetical protein FD119_2817 [Stygiobacter sp.]|nr:MAG: hypothetical protein FD119_2817 [Stygiobacter sp.]
MVDDPDLIIIVDADLLPTLSPSKWRMGSYSSIQENRPYTLIKAGDRSRWPKRVYLARLITGAGEYQMVQHRDGNRLNCRRSNLRVVSTLGPERNKAGKAAFSPPETLDSLTIW